MTPCHWRMCSRGEREWLSGFVDLLKPVAEEYGTGDTLSLEEVFKNGGDIKPGSFAQSTCVHFLAWQMLRPHAELEESYC